MNDLHEQCRANGFVRSKFGRVRHISGIDSSDWWTSKRAKNQCGNFPIASCGADLTKWCMVQVDRELLFRHMESLLICQVHDSLVLDVYKRELRTVINMVREVMVEKAMKVWPFFHKIPLKIDISYGPNWLEQEDYK
jgi:DNA polymerase-1